MIRGSALLAAPLGVMAIVVATSRAADMTVSMPAVCEVPPEILSDSSALPHAARQLKIETRLKIVALGSSSTLGMGASGPAAAYPARLQWVLARMLPAATIQVINKGLARQSVEQMLERMDSDVLAERPALVLWETGTVEAVRGADIDQFTSLLFTGVDRLTTAGADVVLVTPQYSRDTAQVINFQPYLQAIEQVARARNLVLFPRHAVMRHWVDSDRFSFGAASPAEQQKVADDVYDCLGRLLANTIADGVKRER
jgi:acyl-CoA thioesterase-1